MVEQEEKSGITKEIWIHPLRTMNVGTIFHNKSIWH